MERKRMTRTGPLFKTGIPELLLLRLLSEKEMYGYEIVQAIRERTADMIALGEGVLYPALHALEAAGALRSRRRTVAGRTRVYYAATARGRRRLGELTSEWNRMSSVVRLVLKEQANG
jgi:PadR family transcriptional regulator PadR